MKSDKKKGKNIKKIAAVASLCLALTAPVAFTGCSEKTVDVGTMWLSGIDAPAATKGKAGDFYLDTQTLDIYQKDSDGWKKVGSLNNEKGDPGVGIEQIILSGSIGLVKTYTIKYTDGDTDTFSVTDGQNGANGLTPFIGENGNWWIGTEDTGKKAQGEVGKSAYQIAVDNGFEGSEEEWLESLKGEKGETGKSAYEIAKDNGFEGSEEEWLESLKGEQGEEGPRGQHGLPGTPGQKGDDGQKGETGKSAYDIAVDEGFEGSEEEWLESLVGVGIVEINKVRTNGLEDVYEIIFSDESSVEFVVKNGANGLDPFIGENGNWWVGTEDTGKKAQGEVGKSAYEIAKDNGFEGSEEEWLESLKGESGIDITDVDIEYGYNEGGKTCLYFTITYSDGRVETIITQIPPKVTSLIINDNRFAALAETQSDTGLKLTIGNEDGSHIDNVPLTKDMIRGIDDFSVPGEYTCDIVYGNHCEIGFNLIIEPNAELMTLIDEYIPSGELAQTMPFTEAKVYEEGYCLVHIEQDEYIDDVFAKWEYISEGLSQTNTKAAIKVNFGTETYALLVDNDTKELDFYLTETATHTLMGSVYIENNLIPSNVEIHTNGLLEGKKVAVLKIGEEVSTTTVCEGSFFKLFGEKYVINLREQTFDYAADVNDEWDGTIAAISESEENLIEISTASQLAGLAKEVNEGRDFEGYRIVLTKNIDLMNIEWTPIGYGNSEANGTLNAGYRFNGTFDGQGHTIYNLKIANFIGGASNVDAATGVGLFGATFNATIRNLSIDGANVTGNHFTAALVGHARGTTIDDVTVENATINCNYLDSNESGDKAGVIVAFIGISPENGSLVQNCIAKNSKVSAARDAGQIIGCFAILDITNTGTENRTVETNNTVENVVVSDNNGTQNTNNNDNIRNEVYGRVVDFS